MNFELSKFNVFSVVFRVNLEVPIRLEILIIRPKFFKSISSGLFNLTIPTRYAIRFIFFATI